MYLLLDEGHDFFKLGVCYASSVRQHQGVVRIHGNRAEGPPFEAEHVDQPAGPHLIPPVLLLEDHWILVLRPQLLCCFFGNERILEERSDRGNVFRIRKLGLANLNNGAPNVLEGRVGNMVSV